MESQQAFNFRKDDKPGVVRKKLYVFLFCFFASAFVWLIIKLSDEYTEIRNCSVEFTNIPRGKILVNESDTVLTLKLKSKGFRMLSNSWSSETQKIVLDVASVLHKMKSTKNGYYILTGEVSSSIGAQIHQQGDISSVSPDTLYFYMTDNYSKKVPVRSLLHISFAQQYGLSDSVVIYPDSVIVNGPEEIIDSIHAVTTVAQTVSNINSNTVLSLKFQENNNRQIVVRPQSVDVYIPVDKYTESKVEVPVVVTGSEKKGAVKTFPEKVTVTYLVPLSKFKKTDVTRFAATADISKTKQGNVKKLKVEITRMPAFVKILKIDPEKIEYILMKP